jgi:hypothetical protein
MWVGSLTSDDTDQLLDSYERADGVTTLRTGPSVPGATPRAAFRAGHSSDLSHYFFGTSESFVPEDTDGLFDIYESFGSSIRLVSTGPLDSGAAAVLIQRNSADGTHVVWRTPERLTADDADDPAAPSDVRDDLYVRAGGVTRLISGGAAVP